MSEFIVRSSWDTGYEDVPAGSLPEARVYQKRLVESLRKEGVKEPEKWVKIYRLEEMP